MVRLAKCMYISRSLYHTAVSKSWPQSFRTEFQRCIQAKFCFSWRLEKLGFYYRENHDVSCIMGNQCKMMGNSKSGEKPIIYSFTPKGPSDGLLHRGAYGLYCVGIFISFYGVYLMMNCKTKKPSQ